MSKPEQLSLYEYSSCPYCARVRNFLSELGEEIELRDIALDSSNLAELVAATGSQTVPCLRIETSSDDVRWMHESADIVEYLLNHFTQS